MPIRPGVPKTFKLIVPELEMADIGRSCGPGVGGESEHSSR